MAEIVALFAMPFLRFVGASGLPLPGAKLYAFAAGTAIPKAIYTDPLGNGQHPHPAIADSSGQLLVYVKADEGYKFDLFDANDVHQAGWPIDLFAASSISAGQFTPVLKGSTIPGTGTYTSQVGYYQRTGRIVTYTLYMECNAHTGTGNMQIGGFPFDGSFFGTVPIMLYTDGAFVLAGPVLAFFSNAVPARLDLYTEDLTTATIIPMDLAAIIGATTTVNIVVSGSYIAV